jgi:hypothetical protein
MKPSRPTFARTLGLVAGLSLFATGLILIGTAGQHERELPATQSETWAGNGTAGTAYVLPRIPLGVVTTSFTFPAAEGSVQLLDCEDWTRVVEGASPQNPLLVREHVRSSSFTYTIDATLFPRFTGQSAPDPSPPPPPRLFGACSQLFVTFQWAVPPSTAPAENEPSADVHLVLQTTAASTGSTFAGLSVLGAALVLASVLAPRRAPPPAAPIESGTAEALLEATQHSVDWMRRTQRYLAIAGLLGVFLWYPILVPLAFWWGTRLPDGSPPAAMIATVTFVFLAALSLFWWQEHRRLSSDLRAW